MKIFCLLNLIPLVAAIVLGILWYRGDIVFNRLPEGTGTTLLVIAGLIVVLFLVASVSFPIAHDTVKALQASLRRHHAVMKGEAEGIRFLTFLQYPFLWIFILLARVVRIFLILLSLALIAATLLLCVRLFDPDFLKEWIDRILSGINP
ncbi:MAG: hypothetical protein ABIK28_13845 [Planctomycetota bacterium]